MNNGKSSVDVDAALEGAIDLHVHPSPSPFPRRLTIVEAASEAAAAGFGAIAIKSHHHSMVPDVLALQSCGVALDLPVISGVALNNQVGGINPAAVELALSQGGRMVWLPTIAAANHLTSGSLTTFPRSTHESRPNTAVPVLEESGGIRPEVAEVLDLIREYDAVLACGHLAAAEIDVVVAAARAHGVRRIVVNHPNFIVGASPAHCAEWASEGVVVEHSICHYEPSSTFFKWKLDVLLDYVHAVGAQRSMVGSDLGQVGNPTPTEAFRALVPRLADRGVSRETIRALVSSTARSVLE